MTSEPPAARPRAEAVTSVVADRVKDRRQRRGMSQTDLADAMTRHGVPWKRAAVMNLEKRAASTRGTDDRGRDALTVGELLALSLVFDVPAVLLIASVGHTAQEDLAVAQLAAVRAWCDLADEHGDGKLHASSIRAAIEAAATEFGSERRR